MKFVSRRVSGSSSAGAGSGGCDESGTLLNLLDSTVVFFHSQAVLQIIYHRRTAGSSGGMVVLVMQDSWAGSPCHAGPQGEKEPVGYY